MVQHNELKRIFYLDIVWQIDKTYQDPHFALNIVE